MRNLLLVFLLASSSLFAQQKAVKVPVVNNYVANGYLYTPKDYATNTGAKYPVIIFYHGRGEAGKVPTLLLRQGLTRLLNEGMTLDSITNPADGKKYSFIVLSLQDTVFSTPVTWLPYMVKFLKENYRIDSTRIYLTGLSAGGQNSFYSSITSIAAAQTVAAIIPMSIAGTGKHASIDRIGTYKIKSWFFCGDNDQTVTLKPTQTAFDECNRVYPNSSKLTIYRGGHTGWNTFYNRNYKDAVSGLSLYEWLLTNKKGVDAAPLPSLPVKLVSFQVRRSTKGNLLTWTSESEDNFDRYEVEKSSDGKNFSLIAKRNGGFKNYSHADFNFSNDAFYRLKMVDKNGFFSYSKIIAISGVGQILNVSVYDLNGRLLISKMTNDVGQFKASVKGFKTGFMVVTDKFGNQFAETIIPIK